MIIKMKLFAVFCLAFVLSAFGSQNSVEAQEQVVTLSELFQNFEDNHLRAEANYLNKPVRVTGVLRNIESFWGQYYFVEIGVAGFIESFRDRSLIILLGRPVTSQVNYSDFIREVRSGQVTSVDIAGLTIKGVRSDYTLFNTTIPMTGDDQLMDALFNNGVEIRAREVNIADLIKGSLINLTIGETYTFYCESPSKQFLSDTMNLIYEMEQQTSVDQNYREILAARKFGEIFANQDTRELTARPNTRWRLEKQDLAEQNRAYLCTEGKVIQ